MDFMRSNMESEDIGGLFWIFGKDKKGNIPGGVARVKTGHFIGEGAHFGVFQPAAGNRCTGPFRARISPAS